jgi:phosphatidylserine/phosphatidylglycerophosphate/cardiolipin synthase-like enzyme
MNLMHDKFMVLSKSQGKGGRNPQAVLCGSTNFTKNGVYHQGNVVHIARRPAVAKMYLEQFERMVATAKKASDTKKRISEENKINDKVSPFAGFSPRKDKSDLEKFTKLVKSAKRDVLFVTAFAQIDKGLLKAVEGAKGDPILRIGLQNAATTITGFHKDRSARFVTPAMINTGLDGWLKENRPQGQKGNILIHAKIIVVDFTSDTPIIVSGSHNFTNPASAKNDENYLIIHCRTEEDLDLADAYGIEVMRLYDHYRFRWQTQHATGTKAKTAMKVPPALTTDNRWTKPYYGDDAMSTSDRKRFCP